MASTVEALCWRTICSRSNLQLSWSVEAVGHSISLAPVRTETVDWLRRERTLYTPPKALASPAPLLLADEPTGNLDSSNANDVILLLQSLAREEHRAVVVVTHDPRLEEFADRIICLEDGRIVADRRGIS